MRTTLAASLVSVITFGMSSVAASDALHAVRDPDASTLPVRAKLLVLCKCDDLAVVQDVEKQFLESLTKHTAVNPIAASTILLPTRSYTEEARARVLDDSGIQFVFRIVMKSSEQLKKTVAVGTSSGSFGTAVTRTRDAGVVDDFDLAVEARIGGPKLWVASAHYKGSSHAQVADDLADDVIGDLLDKRILPKKPPK